MKRLQHWWLAIALITLSAASFGATTSANPDYQTDGELEQLLAPIALYPDTVLTHILIASTYPLEVVQADRWVKDNNSLGGQAAVDGVSQMDWDPSVQALVAFPDLLDRMSGDLDWLQNLGEAFLADEARVLATVQTLREQAYANGSLDDMKHLKVVRETRTIYIEPVEERVVYLPYYDPFVVYGTWHWPHYPPVYWRHPINTVFVGSFYWGRRCSLAPSFYFGAIAWPRHTVVLIDRHQRPVPYYRAHRIAHYEHAKRWSHNPVHRRNVEYRNPRAQAVFGHPGRPSYNGDQDRNRPSKWTNAPASTRDGQRHSNPQQRMREEHNSRAEQNNKWTNTPNQRQPRELADSGNQRRYTSDGQRQYNSSEERVAELRSKLHANTQQGTHNRVPNASAEQRNSNLERSRASNGQARNDTQWRAPNSAPNQAPQEAARSNSPQRSNNSYSNSNYKESRSQNAEVTPEASRKEVYRPSPNVNRGNGNDRSSFRSDNNSQRSSRMERSAPQRSERGRERERER